MPIEQTVVELPEDPRATGEQIFIIKNKGLRYGTHKFHRYPGKFIPHIPRWAITKYLRERSTVLDPFCGSGTTLVEASVLGHDAVGMDIDPIAQLVSRAKTTPISPIDLSSCQTQIHANIGRDSGERFIPTIPTLAHWFNSEAVRQLSAIRACIDRFVSNQELFNFLCVVFLSVIRRASNADNQTQKTYVSHTHEKTPEQAIPLFLETLADYAARLRKYSFMVGFERRAIVAQAGDASNIESLWQELGLRAPDLVVTSPPYVKSVDYVYNQMAEYFWTGDLFGLETQLKQNCFKEHYIGTDKVPPIGDHVKPLGDLEVDELVRHIARRSKKNANIVHRYFSSMLKHLNQMTNVMMPGTHYVMIVGDSIVSGQEVRTHWLVKRCAERFGFKMKTHFAYEIRNRHMRFPRAGRGGIVTHDHVLDFVLE